MLKDYLKKKKISIYKLAKDSRVPYSTLNDMVNHKIIVENYKFGTAKKLADALHLSLDEFYRICRDNRIAKVVVGDIEGSLSISGRKYQLDFELDGQTIHKDICKVKQDNDLYASTYAEWTMNNIIIEKRLEDSVCSLK